MVFDHGGMATSIWDLPMAASKAHREVAERAGSTWSCHRGDGWGVGKTNRWNSLIEKRKFQACLFRDVGIHFSDRRDAKWRFHRL